jgi:cyanophycin synthetase
VVLSGDDPLLVGLMSTFPAPVVLFSTADPAPRAHVAAGGTLYAVVRGSFARVTRDEEVLLAPVTEAPITFGGAAVHNVANALAAAAVAWSLGLRDSAVSEALRTFGAQPEDNPGRGEVVRTRRGTRVLLDFGHNPAGMRELMRLARSLVGRGGRLASVHTQPGDRTQSDSDALAREIAAGSPRRVVLWESEEYRRGRAPGDIAASLRRGLRAAGMSNRAIDDAPTERAALERALSGAGPADVVVVAPHIEHRDVGELLRGY